MDAATQFEAPCVRSTDRDGVRSFARDMYANRALTPSWGDLREFGRNDAIFAMFWSMLSHGLCASEPLDALREYVRDDDQTLVRGLYKYVRAYQTDLKNALKRHWLRRPVGDRLSYRAFEVVIDRVADMTPMHWFLKDATVLEDMRQFLDTYRHVADATEIEREHPELGLVNFAGSWTMTLPELLKYARSLGMDVAGLAALHRKRDPESPDRTDRSTQT